MHRSVLPALLHFPSISIISPVTDHLPEYSFIPETPHAQRFRVQLRFRNTEQQTAIRFANWTPGSYKIRDYARHVATATASAAENPVEMRKTDKSTYVVSAPVGSVLRVQFEMMGMDDSVRGAWIDPWRAHFEGAAIFPAIVGQEDCPLALDIRAPLTVQDWTCATSLKAVQPAHIVDGWGQYRADSWRDLIDHPLMMGQLRVAEFVAGDCRHRFAIAGAETLQFDFERLIADTQQIVSHQIDIMGGTPNREYLFQLRIAPGGGGGLEHLDSTLLAANREALPQSDADTNRNYESLLGLISHEYFHLWNVKRIRPQAVAESDLSSEAPFPDLWAYEGVTAYFDDWFVCNSGRRSALQYLQILAESLTRLERTPGRLRQSLVEASQDAWIRLYQPEPHLPLTTVSYYLKGAMVALALDLQLRLHSHGDHSLQSVLASQYATWQKCPAALAPHALEQCCRNLCPDAPLDEFFSRCVYGTDDPDFVTLFAAFGIHAQRRCSQGFNDQGGVRSEPPLRSQLGLVFARQGGLQVALVEPESCAENVGMCTGDELFSIDNVRLRSTEELQALLRIFPGGSRVPVCWVHDGRVHTADVALDRPAHNRWMLTLKPNAELDEATRERRDRWLGGV